MSTTKRGVRRASGPALVLLLAMVGDLAAGPAALAGRAAPATRHVPNPLEDLPEPVSLETVARMLAEMGYGHGTVDEAQGFVRVRVRGRNGVYDMFLLPRQRLLHLQIPRLMHQTAADPGADKLKDLLLELNWLNVLGKYSWDHRDGEVRFSYAHVASGGLSFGGFALAVAQCLATVDEDMPRLRSVSGAATAASPQGAGSASPASHRGGSGGRP